MKALPVAGQASSVVERRGVSDRGCTSNAPPPDRNDAAAVKPITAVHDTGLAHLKKRAPAR